MNSVHRFLSGTMFESDFLVNKPVLYTFQIILAELMDRHEGRKTAPFETGLLTT
jgi:hypothetical protein